LFLLLLSLLPPVAYTTFCTTVEPNYPTFVCARPLCESQALYKIANQFLSQRQLVVVVVAVGLQLKVLGLSPSQKIFNSFLLAAANVRMTMTEFVEELWSSRYVRKVNSRLAKLRRKEF